MSLPQEIIICDTRRYPVSPSWENTPRLGVPSELLAIIKDKVKNEAEWSRVETVIKAFEDCIIPWIYNSRWTAFDLTLRECGNLVVKCPKANYGTRLKTSFMLTAIKRVCRRMREDVSFGIDYDGYSTPDYFSNKTK
jgi:hypothetical protein